MTVAELIEELRKYADEAIIGLPNQLDDNKCVLDEPEILIVKAIELPGHEHVLFIIPRERNSDCN